MRFVRSDGERLEAIVCFGRPAFLVASGAGTLAFVDAAPAGSPLFACFTRCWNGVRVHPLHAATLLRAANGRRLRPGDELHIGQERLRLLPARDGKRHRRAIVLGAAVCAAVFALLSVVREVLYRGVASSEAPTIVTPTPDVTTMIAEAKECLRRGEVAQARLALLAGRDRFPDEPAFERLLAALAPKREERVRPNEDRIVRAREAFDRGRRLMQSGELADAARALDAAHAQLAGATPPFADALAQQRRAVHERLRATSARKLESLRSRAINANDLPALAALLDDAQTLAARYPNAEADGFAREMSDRLALRAAHRLRAAEECWRLEGCVRARPLFERLLDESGDNARGVVAIARKHLRACRGEGGS